MTVEPIGPNFGLVIEPSEAHRPSVLDWYRMTIASLTGLVRCRHQIHWHLHAVHVLVSSGVECAGTIVYPPTRQREHVIQIDIATLYANALTLPFLLKEWHWLADICRQVLVHELVHYDLWRRKRDWQNERVVTAHTRRLLATLPPVTVLEYPEPLNAPLPPLPSPNWFQITQT